MGRSDAWPAKVPRFRVIEPHVMRTRTESVALFRAQMDLIKTLPFLEKYNANFDKNERLTLFQIILCACARTFATYPHLNRFIAGRKYWQHNRLQFSYVVKKRLEAYAPETMAKIDFDPKSTLEDVRIMVRKKQEKARSQQGNETEGEVDFFGKFPRWVLMIAIKLFRFLDFFGKMPKGMIESDPCFATAMFANLGSVGLPTPYHHIFEWGTASWFVTVGRIQKVPVVNESGQIVVRDVVELGVILDERISEGIYFNLGLKAMQHWIENPEELTKPPEFTQEQIDELGLIDLDKKKRKKKKGKDHHLPIEVVEPSTKTLTVNEIK